MKFDVNQLSQLIFDSFFILLYLIVLFLFLYVIYAVFTRFLKSKNKAKNAANLRCLQVRIPDTNEVEVKSAEQLFTALYSIKGGFFSSGHEHISFEIIAKESEISFYVICPKHILSYVEKQINGIYPQAEIELITPPKIWDRGQFTSVAALNLSGPLYYPIRTFEDLPFDGISGITSAMSKLSKDETLALQVIVAPASRAWVSSGQRFVHNIKFKSNDPEKRGPSIDTAITEGVEKKLGKLGFEVEIRAVSVSDDKFKSEINLKSLLGSFEQFSDPKYNSFRPKKIWNKKKFIQDYVFRYFNPFSIFIPVADMFLINTASILNSVELATIFHFPNKDVKTPRISWLRSKRASAPANIPTEGLYLGDCDYRGVTTKVHLKLEDRRRHLYIIGQTGTGKSEFMKFMAIQDIKEGKGVGFIDPHGSAIDDILHHVPPERMNDVIYFNAGDEERPLGINILEAKTDSQKHMLINAFIALLYKLYDPNHQGIMGPMLERTLRNVMLTAMEEEGSTMLDAVRLLIDKNYAKAKVANVKDPMVKKFWEEWASTPESKRGENMSYFTSKFDRFVTDRLMRGIIGQPKSSFDFREVMDQKKILLVDLSKGKIGEENSNFIGLLLVPRLLAAALSRADVYGKVDYPDFYLYVDEFQNFSTPDIATILSEARKYRLCMIMANQFIAQLSDDIKTAVFGNVGTMNVFRVGVDDAEYLEQQFKPTFEKSDIINLPIGNSYIRLLIDGHPSLPFSLKVNWDEISQLQKYAKQAEIKDLVERIKQNSRLKYGVDRNIVEEEILRRAQAI